MLTQIINGRILTPQGWLKDGSVLICVNISQVLKLIIGLCESMTLFLGEVHRLS